MKSNAVSLFVRSSLLAGATAFLSPCFAHEATHHGTSGHVAEFHQATVMAAAGLGQAAGGLGDAAAEGTAVAPSGKAAATQDALRDLWMGHIFWVRNVVSDTLAGNSPGAAVSEKQVVANAKALAGAIEPYYGEAASKKLFGLLAGHYGAIKDYLTATSATNKPGQSAALDELTNNAGEIASFLSGANPNLPLDTLRGLLSAHGAHHVQQIQQLKARDFDAEAKTWTAMKDHMHTIADALTQAIAKQFPDRFR